MSYYTVIDGKKLDKKIIEIAIKSVEGQGDGRISLHDAKKIIDSVKDGGIYTDIEKHTMEYLRDHFKWTESADEWFRTQVASWAQQK